MSYDDDDEVIPLGSDLSKHMISEGFIGFETYNQHKPTMDSHGAHTSSVIKVNTHSNELTYIPSYDHSKLTNLLNSKLLLPEDFELIDFLISKTSTFNRQTSRLWFYGCGLVASTISLTLYYSKRTCIYFPAAITSASSFLLMLHLYNYWRKISENQSFNAAVSSLQNLCSNVHNLLRLLKETEILSTGQVTTHNVGAALYIPIKNVTELEQMPSWKTLIHLRKCLANSLVEINDTLRSSCNEAKNLAPNWLHIKGFAFANEIFLVDNQNTNSLGSEGNMSLKDLQLLNDSYLIHQSEFLRWMAFCICPAVWYTPDSNFKHSRNKILKLFHSVNSRLSVISFHLKMHFDVQKIFTEGRGTNQRLLRSDTSDIVHTQLELHNLFLLILSMLTNIRNLEDELEDKHLNNTNLNKDIISNHLKSIRDELSCAMNKFDAYLRLCTNQNTNSIQSCRLENENLDDVIANLQGSLQEENISQLNSYMSSKDEVFLTVTDLNPKERENGRGDWDIESKHQIPSTLMTELSTTLKPIKENFREREKAALERAGLDDISSESDDDDEVTNLQGNLSDESKTTKNAECDHHSNNRGSNASACSMDDSIIICGMKEDSSARVPISDKSIANLIAMKSQLWKLNEEEYYSDG